MMHRKRSFWVLFTVLVLAGACLIVYFSSQNPLPVVPNVNAQIQDSFISDYMRTWQQTAQWSGMNYMLPDIIIGQEKTMNTCFPDCGWTRSTCGIMQCDGGTMSTCGFMPCGHTRQVMCDMGTSLTCDPADCMIIQTEPSGIPQTTSLTCNPIGCLQSTTGSICPGPTGVICTGGNTMIYCPTSTTCGAICSGGTTMLFCPTYRSCIGTCATENPPSFYQGAGPSWGPDGTPMPGGILPFPGIASMPLPGIAVPFVNYLSSPTSPGAFYDFAF